MRDAAENVVYVGKAKDLRQRLNHYRVANPDRMPRRHLRMVREVKRIEFQFCPSESAALTREATLLRSLRPKFNRAGVWPGKARFLVWRFQEDRLEMTVAEAPEPQWQRFGPLGGLAPHLQRTLARLLWLAINPHRSVAGLPAGWAHGRFMNSTTLPCGSTLAEVRNALETFFWGNPTQFFLWLGAKLTERTLPFERGVILSELEVLEEFATGQLAQEKDRQQLALL